MKEGVDYYFNEEGMLVLTEAYHLKQGYCCGHGCLHCPFDHANVPEKRKQELNQHQQQIGENYKS